MFIVKNCSNTNSGYTVLLNTHQLQQYQLQTQNQFKKVVQLTPQLLTNKRIKKLQYYLEKGKPKFYMWLKNGVEVDVSCNKVFNMFYH